jgi:hypothetical protein
MPEMLARYEFKYLIHPDLIPEIRAWARLYCEPDAYGVDGKYKVSSLYLDTVDWMLARQTLEGVRNRFKLRMRTYGFTEEDPVFLENKGRVGTSILKQRALVDRATARALVDNCPMPERGYPALKASHNDDLIRYRNRVDALDMRPRLWVRYDREAYGSAYGDGARLTFDLALEVQVPTLETPFDPDPDSWQRVPLEVPGYEILEMKFNGAFPNWMLRLVHKFGLYRVSCSKYVQGAVLSGHLPWASLERGERWTAF